MPADVINSPVTQFLSENERPFVSEYYEAGLAWHNLDQRTRENAEKIDDYFVQGVKGGQYKDDRIAFSEYMKHLEKVTDTKTAPLSTKLNIISEFIGYQMRRKEYGA